METHVKSETPLALERLRDQLQTDNAKTSTISVQPGDYSHGRTCQKFEITLAGKRQVLTSLFRQSELTVLDVSSKRSGAQVRTTILVKVTLSTANTLMN